MTKIFKTGRVVVVTAGRFAGKKAVVVKTYDGNSKRYKFPNVLLMGIARNLERVKRRVNRKTHERQTSVKLFIKHMNENHVLPTRYLATELDLKDFNVEATKKIDTRAALKKEWREKISNKYRTAADDKGERSNGLKLFFNRLRF